MSTVWRHGANNPAISICIPTFDRSQRRVDEAVASVCLYTQGYEWEIVILDCEGELRGYTEPMNEAMDAAKGEILVAMNDDVIAAPGWMSMLIGALHDGAWCATPDMTHTDGPQVFAPYCMAWWRCHWHEVGGLDSQFQWWCSDIDLARRLMDMGHPPVRVRLEPPIEHAIGSTATDPSHQATLNEWAAQDLDRFRKKWGEEAEREKVRMAVAVGANTDPRLAHWRIP